MTAGPRLRRFAHRGSVAAIGVVIDRAGLGEAEARARVLAWWAPGGEVRDVDGAWILRWPVARRMTVAAAPGGPLVATHGVVATLPLTAAEVAALAAPSGAVVLATGGGLRVVVAGQGSAVDPAAWLEVDALEVVEVTSLGAPPTVVVVPAPVRVELGVAAADPEAAAVRTALLRPRAASSGAAAGAGEGAPGGRAPWWARLVARVFGTSRPVAQLAAGDAAGAGRADAGATLPARPLPSSPAAPPRPSWLDRLRARAALALWRSALGGVIGRRHADYLRDTLAMFDRGDLDEALRRAIPLGGDGADEDDTPRRLGVALPTPRAALTPSLTRQGAGATIPLAVDAMALLRERYQAARDRLIRAGRYEEAAFVIADLLRDPAAAVAMLEAHDRRRLAAELAEARGLAPGLVIRQWFVAGEPARAIAIAWRTGAFADAIARAGDGELADRLRLAWASALADAGDYLGAVHMVAALDDPAGAAAAPVDRWIELGIAGGGVAAARLWVCRLRRPQARFDEIRAAVLPILARDDADGLDERIAIARDLVAAPAEPRTATLARAAARALLADVGRGVDGEPAVLLPRLVRLAGDGALRADLPALGTLPRRDALVDRTAPVVHRWQRRDAGAIAVHDVALVPGGRVLVALGELGVRLLAGDGRTIARWDQPAEALVVGDHGTQAIAIARRGRTRRLARIDLAGRTARRWCEAELDGWAPSFDGGLWLVTRGRELLAIETGGDELRAGWGVTSPGGGSWTGLARDGAWWTALLQVDLYGLEQWSYQHFTLRRRAEVAPFAAEGGFVAGIAAQPGVGDGRDLGGVIALAGELGDPTEPRLAWTLVDRDGRRPLDVATWPDLAGGGAATSAHLVAAGRFAAVIATLAGGGAVVEVHYLPSQRPIARLGLDGTGALTARFGDLCLTIADDLGRVIVLDLRTGGVRYDLRVR